MTIENPTVKDMELIALNLHKEGENSRSEALYKFIAKYKANERKVTALETAGRPIKETLDNLIADNHLESPEILNDVWVSVLGSHLVKFAALLGETK